jgi:hypothetical protein
VSLSDLASVGSLVGGVAVLVSLLLLYVQLRQIGEQIRQAEKNQKAAIGQGRTNRMVEISLRSAEPGLSQALVDASSNSSDITPHQLFQVLNYSRALFLNAEDTYYQHARGLLEDEPFAGFVNAIRGTVANPSMRYMWQSGRGLYGPEFVRWVDTLVEETPLGRPAVPDQLLALWKAGMNSLLEDAAPAIPRESRSRTDA